jgi:hypothetical protein
MPSFKNIIATSEIWNIISFIRSFNGSYKQEIMPVITSSAYPGAVIKMSLSFNKADSSFILKASAQKDNSVLPVSGAEVKLYVHRTFGLLPVDDTKTTDKDGLASFRISGNLPGDTAGNVTVSARFTNEDIFGTVSTDTVLSAGVKTYPVSLVAERGMWNNVRMAPIWLILTFSLGLLTAWGFIFFVLLKLRDIYIVGTKFPNGTPGV